MWANSPDRDERMYTNLEALSIHLLSDWLEEGPQDGNEIRSSLGDTPIQPGPCWLKLGDTDSEDQLSIREFLTLTSEMEINMAIGWMCNIGASSPWIWKQKLKSKGRKKP
ncbi:hypothetical protein GX50_07159 [[Emmonsia] crescens]|uniref:Uncharacterized protein n=1 Tax=[Emmonsia] crescens TaxID=73230 RepID=A0A2B7ZB86_9EURO|nr:hypothetical protein GX50_07159 [Emmonsia crescens]